jgi:release factor glutamine methyltransferase
MLLQEEELARYKSLFRRRLAHEPLQYILGETEFMGLKLHVDRRVLIPRPETEVLVETVLRLARTLQAPRILDVGTGSGNISRFARSADHIGGHQRRSARVALENCRLHQ